VEAGIIKFKTGKEKELVEIQAKYQSGE